MYQLTNMRDILKSKTNFNPHCIKDPENIRNLYVGHNNLNFIDFSRFKNLESLDIGHNNINNIENLPISLKWLCVADNPIEDYDRIYDLINLETLWAHQSNIDISECFMLKNITHLLIDDCPHICDVSVLKQFTKLNILEAQNNSIENISPLFGKRLSFLNLMNNNVTDIDSLSNMGTLKKLNIRGNLIKNYEPLKTLNLRRLCL